LGGTGCIKRLVVDFVPKFVVVPRFGFRQSPARQQSGSPPFFFSLGEFKMNSEILYKNEFFFKQNTKIKKQRRHEENRNTENKTKRAQIQTENMSRSTGIAGRAFKRSGESNH
jgi:hypothetical protein